MDEEITTPAPAITHEPPSLPNSPEPKRTRLIDDSVPAVAKGPSNIHPTLSAHPTKLTAKCDLLHPKLSTTKIIHTSKLKPPRFCASIANWQGKTALPFNSSGAATPTPINMASSQQQQPAASTVLEVKFLSDKARAPTKGSEFAAGHDLYSARTLTIPARGRARVDTDIAISTPAGTCKLKFVSKAVSVVL